MKVSHQVVSPPPIEGSVLGRIVAGDSVLGQLLYWIAFSLANARMLASVQAELAALRAQKYRDYVAELHHVSEFAEPPAPISSTDEPLFSKPRYLRLEAQRQAKTAATFVRAILEDGPREHAIGFASLFVRQLRAFEKGMRGCSENDLLIIDRCFLKELRARTKTALQTVRAEGRAIEYCSLRVVSRFALTVRYQKLVTATVRDSARKAEKRVKELSCSDYLDRIANNVGIAGNWRESSARTTPTKGSSEYDKKIAAIINLIFNPQPHPKGTPYDPAWNGLRSKALEERYSGHLNFCPRCWVARVQGVVIPKEQVCLDCIGLRKLDEAEATKAAKRARTLAEYCAEFKKDNSTKLAAKGWAGYSPEEFDRDILKSRGSVMDDVVHQFEKNHSRRLNKWRLR